MFRRYAPALKTPQDAIVLLGLFIGLCYLPNWVRFLLTQINNNASGSFCLVVCFVLIGIFQLREEWDDLVSIQPVDADRWLGNCLVIVGIFLFPFCRFALWSQALLWLLVLGGIAMSSWGISFFFRYSRMSWAFILSAYPNPGHLAGTFWKCFLPPEILESFMAGITSTVLRWAGESVTLSGPFLIFPTHIVKVGWGCNGFDMMLAMMGASLFLGQYLKLTLRQIIQLSVLGIVLALLVNIPRLVLMSIAAVYWEDKIFEFWHGSWGGQVFVGVLFVVYYYGVTKLSPNINQPINE